MEVCLLFTFVYKWFMILFTVPVGCPRISLLSISVFGFWLRKKFYRLQSFEVDLEFISRNIRTPYRPNPIKSNLPITPRTLSEFQLEFTVSFLIDLSSLSRVCGVTAIHFLYPKYRCSIWSSTRPVADYTCTKSINVPKFDYWTNRKS